MQPQTEPVENGQQPPPPEQPPLRDLPALLRLWALLRAASNAAEELEGTLDHHICTVNSRGFCDVCAMLERYSALDVSNWTHHAAGIIAPRLPGYMPHELVEGIEAEMERLLPDAPRIGGGPPAATVPGESSDSPGTVDPDPAEAEEPKPAPVNPRLDRWKKFQRRAARAVYAILILARAIRHMQRLHREHEEDCPRKGQEVHSCQWCGRGDPPCAICEGVRLLDFMEVHTWAYHEIAEQLAAATDVSDSDEREHVRELERICDRMSTR